MLIVIRLKQDWTVNRKAHKAGDVVRVESTTADNLVDVQHAAERLAEDSEAAAVETPETATPTRRSRGRPATG